MLVTIHMCNLERYQKVVDSCGVNAGAFCVAAMCVELRFGSLSVTAFQVHENQRAMRVTRSWRLTAGHNKPSVRSRDGLAVFLEYSLLIAHLYSSLRHRY